MRQEDAEEYTKSLGLIGGGWWRQIALAKKLGVPKALGLSTDQWVNDRLGGYVKLSVDDRRKAVAELKQNGESTRAIAEVLGVDERSVRRDIGAANAAQAEDDAETDQHFTDGGAANAAPGPIDAAAVLAADEKVRARAAEVKRKQALAEKRAAESRDAPSRLIEIAPDLRHCSCSELLSSGVKPDVIITDPPYPREFLHVYSELAEAAKDVPLVAVMVGHVYLPEVLERMSKHLKYRWVMAYLTPGGQSAQQFSQKVNTFWKPVLIFGEAVEWIGDVVKSDVNDNDKQHHHWGQSESGMADLIKRLSKPGQLVCDPFLGGGTTAVVSIDMGRKFVGCDVDPGCVEKTRLRIYGK